MNGFSKQTLQQSFILLGPALVSVEDNGQPDKAVKGKHPVLLLPATPL